MEKSLIMNRFKIEYRACLGNIQSTVYSGLIATWKFKTSVLGLGTVVFFRFNSKVSLFFSIGSCLGWEWKTTCFLSVRLNHSLFNLDCSGLFYWVCILMTSAHHRASVGAPTPSVIMSKHPATSHFLLHLEAKRELKVHNSNRLLPFCQTSSYLGVKLKKSLMFRHHLVALQKKFFARLLLTRFIGSGWGAGAKTLRKVVLSLVYSTAEYCAPV